MLVCISDYESDGTSHDSDPVSSMCIENSVNADLHKEFQTPDSSGDQEVRKKIERHGRTKSNIEVLQDMKISGVNYPNVA